MDLSPGVKVVAQGHVSALQKPSLGEVWPHVEFHRDPPSNRDSRKKKTLGMLSMFLEQHGLDGNNAGKRAAEFNAALGRMRVQGKLRYLKIPGKRGGPKFWLGTKKVLGAVQKHCLL